MPFPRALLSFVVFALVAAQALGLMHRVVHAPYGGARPAALHSAQGEAPGHARASWVEALFAGHADDSSCRLFDPLNHEGAAAVPAVVLPAVLASFFIDFFQGEFLSRWAALYDARGPPTLR